MQNISDNELDNLFKEAAEGFKPPQDETAWQQMADRLDRNPVTPESLWNWKTVSTLTVSGIISVTAIWFTLTTQEKFNKTHEKDGANNATHKIVQEQKEQPNPIDKENLPAAQSVEDKSSGPRALTDAGPRRSKPNSKNLVSQKKSYHGNDFASASEDEISPTGNALPVMTIDDERTSERGVQHTEIYSLPTSIKVNNVKLVNVDSVEAVTEHLKADSATHVLPASDKKENKAGSGSRFSIKASFSPDFSSVNYFSAGKTGSNFGLLAGYTFNNRWSVYTGVISSRKRYDTKDVEGSYQWNDRDYPLKELDGDCRILDIPVNVYYTFFPERSFSLRAGLGFSSYIMRKETYVYSVDNYGKNAYYEQNVKGENNEWFKVMNVSVLVSKKITNRLSAEFEPFVKAPLAGVGEGKVSLVSMGAFINVKYDLIIFK